jgi:hypothetical protein
MEADGVHFDCPTTALLFPPFWFLPLAQRSVRIRGNSVKVPKCFGDLRGDSL